MSSTWLRKMETFFVRIDVDRDGEITVKDFEALAEKLIESGHLDAERGSKLKSNLVEVWNKFFKVAADEKPLKRGDFREAAKQLHKNKDFHRLAADQFELFFTAIDTDGDGSIQEEEFSKFFKIIGLDAEMAKFVFQIIDTNNDGVLSREEYVAAGMEFCESEDEALPTKFFWGPLVYKWSSLAK